MDFLYSAMNTMVTSYCKYVAHPFVSTISEIVSFDDDTILKRNPDRKFKSLEYVGPTLYPVQEKVSTSPQKKKNDVHVGQYVYVYEDDNFDNLTDEEKEKLRVHLDEMSAELQKVEDEWVKRGWLKKSDK